MKSTEHDRAPSLIKATLIFVATATLLAVSSRAPAQGTPPPHAQAGSVSVRIRDVDAMGLAPAAIADWLTSHDRRRATFSAQLFAMADADGNGRVDAFELKDLMIGLART